MKEYEVDPVLVSRLAEEVKQNARIRTYLEERVRDMREAMSYEEGCEGREYSTSKACHRELQALLDIVQDRR